MSRDKVQCGNPLFLAWLEELRDLARDKGTKAAESYGKACRSVATCPTTFERPRDLVVLQGVGPKIVNVLEGKWKAYCQENGLPSPGTPEKRPKGKQKVSQAPFTTSASEREDTPTAAPPAKKRKPSKPKVYIPAKGSGGYGLLIGLVLAIERPEINTQVFLTKGELIRTAQPYSDSSYEHSEKGTYFNAWSSMKSLVSKGYVYVTGNPHKYCLTPEGYDVAVRIRSLLPEFGHLPQLPWQDESVDPLESGRPSTSRVRLPSTTLPPSPPATASDSSVPPSRSRAEKFRFWYIDSAGRRIETLEQATSRLDPDEFVTVRKLEFRLSQMKHPFVSHLRLVDNLPRGAAEDGEQTVFAFIMDDDAPPRCSKFGDESRAPAVRVVSGVLETATSSKAMADDWIETLPSTAPPPKAPPHSTFAKTMSAPLVLSQPSEAAPFPLASTSAISRSHSASKTTVKSRPQPRLSSHIPTHNPLLEEDEDTAGTPSKIPDFDPSNAIVYPAGSYDVILILDTREVESKTNRDLIAEKLKAKGVNVETRALRLGDMCWIARRRDGVGGEEDECVLDYVVERKRLDDLCSSIKDGRYTEQCFRLTNSCVNHIYYIVEDWQTSHHMEWSGQQIMTAKSQIQVHNRFFLQETHRLSETIDFLTMMTKIITASHQDIELHVIPTRYLSRSTYRAFQKHLRTTERSTSFLTSWQAYQDLNDKNASRTLKETFARMMMCVRGMSAEKVSAILDQFETPISLWEALKARREEEQVYLAAQKAGTQDDDMTGAKKAKGKSKRRGPELFFADGIPGEGRRKIGDALSKDLYRAFMGSHDDDTDFIT